MSSFLLLGSEIIGPAGNLGIICEETLTYFCKLTLRFGILFQYVACHKLEPKVFPVTVQQNTNI